MEGGNARGGQWRVAREGRVAAAGLGVATTGLGSLMAIHFRPGPIHGTDDLKDEDPRLQQLFPLAMLARGIYLSPRGMVALSLPMGEAETDALLEAVAGFVEDYGPLLPRAAAGARGPDRSRLAPDDISAVNTRSGGASVGSRRR